MGCDIHYVIERNYDGRWVGVMEKYDTPAPRSRSTPVSPQAAGVVERDEWMERYNRRPAFGERDYGFFAALAGVRGKGPEPRGWPDDVSELTDVVMGGDGDLHSKSWATYREWCEIYALLDTSALTNDGKLAWLSGVDEDELDLYRVIYAFDN